MKKSTLSVLLISLITVIALSASQLDLSGSFSRTPVPRGSSSRMDSANIIKKPFLAQFNTQAPCEKHPGGKFQYGDSLNFAFNNGKSYQIALTGLRKQSFKGTVSYLVNFTVNGYTLGGRLYDVMQSGYKDIEGLQIMAYGVTDNDTVYFKIYSGCNLPSSSEATSSINGQSEVVCTLYAGPGTYQIHACDRLANSVNSSIQAYVESVDNLGVHLTYRVKNQKGEFTPSPPHLSITSSKLYGAGYFGLNIKSNGLKYDAKNQTASVSIVGDPQEIYKACMSKIQSIDGCAMVVPSTATPTYSVLQSGPYIVKGPTEYLDLVKCRLYRLKYSMPNGEQYFGFSYPFNSLTHLIVKKNPLETPGDFGAGWGMLSGVYDNMKKAAEYINCEKNINNLDTAYIGMTSGHEPNHNFVNNSVLNDIYGDHAEFEEGLVNYVAQVNDMPSDKIICKDAGYLLGVGQPLMPFKSEDTFSGQCFWQMIEEKYGHAKFQKIMMALDQSRYNIVKAGRKPAKSLFKDIINPILGTDAFEKNAQSWFGYFEVSY